MNLPEQTAGLSGPADTHCHLDFPEFDPDRDTVIASCLASGLEFMINAGSSPSGAAGVVSLAERHPAIYACVGCHPHDADSFSREDLRLLEELSLSKKVVAIGEAGLDFYRNLSSPEHQEKVFVSLIELARKKNLPLVIHSRQAHKRTMELLSEHNVQRAVIHCFSGPEDFLAGCLDQGCMVSFTANISYRKAGELRRLVKLCPLDRMMLETDSPFLPPEGMRGSRNTPVNVRTCVRIVAEEKGITFSEVAAATTATAKKFFGIRTP